MKILWLGVSIGPSTKERLLSAGGQIRSAQISQQNLLEGLKSVGLHIDTINGPQLSSTIFPTIQEEVWSDGISDNHIMVGYRNIQYINRLNKEKAIVQKAIKWAKRNKQEKKVVIFIYSMHTPFLRAAVEVKKIIPCAVVAMIVPDLPQFMDMKMGRFKKTLKKLDWNRIQRLLPYVDKYILYAKPMAEFLQLKADQWIVMEGSFDSTILGENQKEQINTISIMYSGVLDLRYGIPELLDAMKMLPENYELWLTGDGNARYLIEERSAADNRIKYYGYLPTRRELLDKQTSATMLISPRRDIEEGSKYCFPSKLFEYMATGKPVISCYLDGIPEEYHQFLIELKTVNAKEIADTVKTVAGMSYEQRESIGNAAKEFVLLRKNKYAQAKKMWEFVKK